ncbi:hypothetical protein GUJ93_ZPchr0004g40447 [Zizania palustris]|uniref:Uncharacterized protein n=1 Tax=Zizania palustris TaxID=103762 RepID=A0A8J5SPV3_ZIZPA|nr:hypothetical protein GUJ93_ZPchr0004g40447 [Zizania palustris]
MDCRVGCVAWNSGRPGRCGAGKRTEKEGMLSAEEFWCSVCSVALDQSMAAAVLATLLPIYVGEILQQQQDGSSPLDFTFLNCNSVCNEFKYRIMCLLALATIWFFRSWTPMGVLMKQTGRIQLREFVKNPSVACNNNPNPSRSYIHGWPFIQKDKTTGKLLALGFQF